MALTRITKGVIKPNENYDTHNINSTGIVTAIGLDINGNGDVSGNLSVGGVLTYEDVTSIDSVGIITAQKDIHVGAGVSAVGVGTFGSLDINGDIDVDGHTNLDNVSIAGVTTTSGNVNVSGITTSNTGFMFGTNGEHYLYKSAANTATLRVTSDGPYVEFKDVSGDVQLGSASGTLRLSAGGNEKVRITSAGDLSLRTTTQNAYLGLTANSTAINLTLGSVTGTNPRLYLKGVGNGQSDAGDVFLGAGTGGIVEIRSAELIKFEVNSDSSTAEALRIHADGEVECKGGAAGQNALLVSGNYTGSGNVDIQTWQRIGGAVQAKLIYKDADTSIHFGTDTAHKLCLMTSGTERLRITSDGNIRQAWSDGKFMGQYYDSTYYMGFTFGATARTLYIDNRSNDTRADIVFRTGESASLAERLRIYSSGIVQIDQGTAGGNHFKIVNDEISLLAGVNGTGDTYAREAFFGTTRVDSGSLPILRIAGQGGIKFCVDANSERLRINSNGDILTSGTSQLFGSNTSDGSDNKSIMINGGGAVSDSRGGYLIVHGNEHASFPGITRLHAGNVGTANIQMYTAGSERLRINSNGSVNIGGNYTETNYALQVTGLGGDGAKVLSTGGDVLTLESSTASSRTTLKFNTNGNDWEMGARGSSGNPNNVFYIYDNASSSYRMVIDSNGRTLFSRGGLTASRNVGTKTGEIQVSNTGNSSAITILAYSNDVSGPHLMFGKSRSTNATGNTIVQNGDRLGEIAFCGNDGADFDSFGAAIKCHVDGTPGANDMPGRLQFYTTADGGSSAVERLRITSTGAVMINTTNSSARTLNLRGNFGILSTSQTGVMTMDVTDAGEATIAPYVTGGSTLTFKTNASGSGVAERLRITNTGAFYIKSPSYIAGDQPGELQWWNENGAGVMAKIVAHREGSNYAPSGLKFYTTQNVDTSANNSQGDITERFFINSEGKFYKGGSQFYPCVQIYEARISGAVSNSAGGAYQDIKTLATYTPKKSGNRVHVQMICQTWHAPQVDGPSGDTYARLQHNNSGSHTTFTENDRVQGNFAMDERYHHASFIMDGWFTTTTTNSTTIKLQGYQPNNMHTAFNWFHAYGGRITIMEYDIT